MHLQDFSTNSLRKGFLEFFKSKGHKILPSSSLLPENDPSVLFTTAGMQQFKRFYDRPDEAPAASVATCQKCIRTGDIEEVGDETHDTFFEMLGNFSFGYPGNPPAGGGSYFKKEAIEMAWEFLTEVLDVKKERLSCTYFAGDKGIPEDHESRELLKEITGLDDAKVLGTGFDETFWSLGTEGSPGGPTVEFYIDGVEIWNLVFNQYKFKNGKYVASEFKGVDTGMGFERLVMAMQDKPDIYQTDLFWPLILEIEKLTNLKYGDKSDKGCEKEAGSCWVDTRRSFRIIADHVRAATFMINEGIEPSNKGQGYILRRLIRRAVVKARNLKINQNFTAQIAAEVVKIYSDYNLDFKKIEAVLEGEEAKFRKGLENGLKILSAHKEFDGKILFDLYQSYGIPLEISVEEVRILGIEISQKVIEDYQSELASHQEKSRTASAGMFKGGLAGDQDATRNLHTATHMLLAALRQVLGSKGAPLGGDHVLQRGSNITPERLRFDFSYGEKMTEEQIKKVEDLVNEKIKEALPVRMEEMPVFEAKESGAMGVFDEKYSENVKVYTIGPSTREARSGSREEYFSREICGGPHAENTSALGHFKIIKEESSSSGVRRIKAILE